MWSNRCLPAASQNTPSTTKLHTIAKPSIHHDCLHTSLLGGKKDARGSQNIWKTIDFTEWFKSVTKWSNRFRRPSCTYHPHVKTSALLLILSGSSSALRNLERSSEPGDKLHLSLQSRAVTKRLNLMYYEEPQHAPGSTSQTGLPYAKKKKRIRTSKSLSQKPTPKARYGDANGNDGLTPMDQNPK